MTGRIEDQVVLDLVRFGAEARISEAQLLAGGAVVEVRRVMDKLVARVTAEAVAEKLPPATIERNWSVDWPFPASPWQHWKHKHGGAWWLRWFVRRWPVRVERHARTMHLRVDIERYRTFPESRLKLPDATLGRPVLYAQTAIDWSERP